MIDFIKAYFTDKDSVEARFEKCENKKVFESVYKVNNNVNGYLNKSNFDNLVVRFTNKKGSIENSLHKRFNILSNQGNQNYNDFSFDSLLFLLDKLEQELKVSLKETHLTQIEFGFNLNIGVCPNKVLDENILMYKFRTPCVDPKNLIDKKIKKFIFRNYEVKIYNKSLHYKLKNESILRVEVKYKTKKEFNKFGLYGLDDLRNRDVIYNMFNDFIDKFDNLLIVDSYDGNSEMSKKERELITKGTHPNYWIDLDNNLHRNTVLKRKKEVLKLIKKYRLNSWKKELRKQLFLKYKLLMGQELYDIKKCA